MKKIAASFLYGTELLLHGAELLLRGFTRYSTEALSAKKTLHSKLDEISGLKESSITETTFNHWRSVTIEALDGYFGEDSPLVAQFRHVTKCSSEATEEQYVETLNAAAPVLRLAVASTEAVPPHRARYDPKNVVLKKATRGVPGALWERAWQLVRSYIGPLIGRKHKAKYLLNLRVAELDSGNFRSSEDAGYAGWKAHCFSTLTHLFGSESTATTSFSAVTQTRTGAQGTSFNRLLDQSRAVLMSSIEDVDELGIRGGFFDNALVRNGPLVTAAGAIVAAIVARLG